MKVNNVVSNKRNKKDRVRISLAKWVFTPLAGVTLGSWVKVLKRHGRTIPPRYWPRNIFTIFMGIVNSLMALREPDTWKDEKYKPHSPIFIIGHHRSGTTHLWQLLSVDKNFIYPTVTETIFPHTMLSMEKLTNKLAELFSPGKRPQDNVRSSTGSPMGEEWALCTSTFLSTHMARHFPKNREFYKKYLTMKNVDENEREKWKQALDRFARKLLLRYGNDKTLLFKAPPNTAKIKLILELYPDARFIHIYRNPYRVFQSALHMEMNSRPMCTYQDMNFAELKNYIIWRYKAMYNSFLEDAEDIPDEQLTQLSFEELEKDRFAAIRKIYIDLGLPDFPKMEPELEKFVESIAGYQKNEYLQDEGDRELVAKEWGKFIRFFGYEQSGQLL
ncbi:MAG: sulfotransferase [Balneolaceae bacterium]